MVGRQIEKETLEGELRWGAGVEKYESSVNLWWCLIWLEAVKMKGQVSGHGVGRLGLVTAGVDHKREQIFLTFEVSTKIEYTKEVSLRSSMALSIFNNATIVLRMMLLILKRP